MVKSFCCFNATLPVSLALSVGLAAGLVIASQSSAQALSFRFSFDNNSSDEFQSAVTDAARAWSSLLKDDVVVDLRIRYIDLNPIGGDILGGAQPGKIQVSYDDYVNAAFKDVVSRNDYRAANNLQLDTWGKQQVKRAQWGNSRLYSNANVSAQEFSFLSDKSFGDPNPPTNNSYQNGSYSNGGNNEGDYYHQQDGYYYDGHYYPAYYAQQQNGVYTSGYYIDSDEYDYDDAVDDYYRNYQSSYSVSQYSSQYNNQGSQQTSRGYVDSNSSNNNKNVSLTKAQAKALGLLNPEKRGLDGVISINSSINWDLYQEDGIERDRYDVTTVLQHEIGHALGIVSGSDALDFLYSSGDAGSADLDSANGFSYLTPMDFYRYSSESANLGMADVTLGGEKYFSLDGGKSAVRDRYGRAAYFSTGSLGSGGDGYQGSHWKEGNSYPLGVMNPTLRKGRSNPISDLDLTLLDVVGWDLEDSTQKKAAVIGVDWRGLQRKLISERYQVVNKTVDKWSKDIPALEAAIQDASVEIDARFNKQLQDKFYVLSESLRRGDKGYYAYRNEVNRFYSDIYEDAAQRNRQIESIPYDVYNIDLNVRKWLAFSTEQLSERMRTAEIEEINRLSHIVKAAPYEERLALEAKLREAVAPFADQPTRLVQELLDTSGPANPIAYGYPRRWWSWYQFGENGNLDTFNDGDDSQISYYSEMAFQRAGSLEGVGAFDGSTSELPALSGLQPVSGSALSLSTFDTNAKNVARLKNSKDIPEPSTVLGLFGIAVLGMAGCRRKYD